jgi:hypothetical protein
VQHNIKQQGAAGKYNQAVQNRNAQIAEQEAAQIEKQLEFDLARFDQNFNNYKDKLQVAYSKSGADIIRNGFKNFKI